MNTEQDLTEAEILEALNQTFRQQDVQQDLTEAEILEALDQSWRPLNPPRFEP